MIVTKSVWVDVKDGSPENVIEGLMNCQVPPKARLADINYGMQMVVDYDLRAVSISGVGLKYEWMDEE